jgi:ubiquinone/menaquinone biosynthesis C-methylase UbiE
VQEDNIYKRRYVIDIDGNNGIAERERLKRQGKILTSSKALPVLPDGFSLQHGRVVDLACGAGELALRWADPDALGSNVEIIGVDLNGNAIEYANEMARLQQKENVEFRVMDILQPLEFEDESCDLVHARLVVGVLPKEYWTILLEEIHRILKPGGTLRLIESSSLIIENAPNQHRMSVAANLALWRVGKTFSQYEVGTAAALNRYLKQSPFIDMKQHACFLDYSYGMPLHEPVVIDFLQSTSMLKPLITAYGDMSAQEFDETLAGMASEMWSEEYSSLFGLICYDVTKAFE